MKEGVTIGIPVHNEEALLVPNTERLLSFLDGLGRDYEVLIGSNGSDDSTAALGTDLPRRFPRVRFFHLREKGVGTVFSEFVRRARCPLLVSLDMDLSVDLSFVPQALALLENHDIVIGAKSLGRQRRSWFRKLASDLFIYAAHLLLGVGHGDYSIAAKAFRVERLRRLGPGNNAGSAYVLDICFRAHREGLAVVQIPVACEDWRTSKFNLLHEGLYKYGHLLGLWLRTKG